MLVCCALVAFRGEGLLEGGRGRRIGVHRSWCLGLLICFSVCACILSDRHQINVMILKNCYLAHKSPNQRHVIWYVPLHQQPGD